MVFVLNEMRARQLALKEGLRYLLDAMCFGVVIEEAGSGCGHAPGGDHDAAVLREGFDLLVGLRREPIDSGQDQHLVWNANAVDCVGIDEVEIEAGVEHLRDDGAAEELLHRFVDGDIAAALIEAAGRGGRLMLLDIAP